MVQQIKELRVKIDGLHQLTKELRPLILDDGNDYTWGLKDINPENEPDGKIGLDYFLTANSKEINKSTDSLIMAKAWLGKLLKQLGEKSPYSSGKKTVEDIEPTADAAHLNEGISEYSNIQVQLGVNPSEIFNAEIYKRKNHIEKVDWLRSEIQKVIDELSFRKDRTLNAWNATNMAYNHLCEAKMWLGFELGRVRDEF